MLSVVIPTFRKPQLLRRTLTALEPQAIALDVDCEIVVVDDGSGDETPVVIPPGDDVGEAATAPAPAAAVPDGAAKAPAPVAKTVTPSNASASAMPSMAFPVS